MLLPILLFVATCLSTYLLGGPVYCAGIMFILGAHEMGHFIQSHRYHVPASWPYFIPMPISFFGTAGAVIVMQPGRWNRQALFDIAITGPIAGLIPAVALSVIGLSLSSVHAIDSKEFGVALGEPLLFQWLVQWKFGPMPAGHDVVLHPLAYAGWVGIFITALNLVPIGQLDGGHILYALLLKKSRPVAIGLLLAAIAGVVAFGYYGWTLMLILIILFRPTHPPTADDTIPLGATRTALGWLALLFVIIGFTPNPFPSLG